MEVLNSEKLNQVSGGDAAGIGAFYFETLIVAWDTGPCVGEFFFEWMNPYDVNNPTGIYY